MSIRFQAERCCCCGKCAGICPGNLIGRDESGRAFLRRPEDCWGCAACVKECAFGALALTLGEDIGGRGGTLRITRQGELCHWIYEAPAQQPVILTLNPNDANQY